MATRERILSVFCFLLAGLLLGGCAGDLQGRFDVMDFGARGDGKSEATAGIQAAIDQAAKAGGGTVVIPRGKYICGPIRLASHMVLEVEAGAVVEFPARRLELTEDRVQGIECLAPVPLMDVKGAEDVTIRGAGTLMTDNAAWVKLYGGPEPASGTSKGSAFGPEWNHLLDLLKEKTPRSREEYEKAAERLRPTFLRVMKSKHVTIEGIRMVGSSFWTIHLLYSQKVAVRNVKQETFPGIFTGGIYVDSTRDVVISGCDLDNGDDAIALKAGKDADGLRVNRPTKNVVIRDCIIHRGSGGIVMGSETAGWIRNVLAKNIVCQGTQYGINIKTERGRGGGVENVRIDGVVMEDVGKAISVSEFYTMQGEVNLDRQPVGAGTPTFRDIRISHVTIKGARGYPDFSWNPISTSGTAGQVPVTIEIEGLPERPMEGLRINDVVATGAAGVKARDAAGLELRNVVMNAASGPAFLVRDCPGVRMEGVTTTRPVAGVPVVWDPLESTCRHASLSIL